MTKEVVVVTKCISCGAERTIRAGEIKEGEQPMCDKCFMPMIAKESKIINKYD